MIAAKLDAAIKVVAPIYGVSIGRENDKATWGIDFIPEATAEQRKAAQAVLAAFDAAAVEAEPSQAVTVTQLRAALTALNGGITPAQVDAAIAAAVL